MKSSAALENVASWSMGAEGAISGTRGYRRRLNATLWLSLLAASLLFLVGGGSDLSAAVIYTPVSGHFSVGTGDLTGGTLLTVDLPGVNDLAIIDFSYTGVQRSNFYQLTILNSGTAFIAADIAEGLYYAHALNINQTWADLPVGQTGSSFGANISRMAQTGNASFDLRSDPTYLPFRFTDSTDSITKYGYIALATAVAGSGASAQFSLDVIGYAYENSGAVIAMGAVPEPSTVILAAFGVLGLVVTLRGRRGIFPNDGES